MEPPLEMVRNSFKTRFENAGRKNILLVCVHYPHARECTTALHAFFNARNVILLHDLILIHL